eukprot:9467348-Pyramimonas_sp.AAC.1
MRLRRVEKATGRGAQWLQAPHAHVPYGRDIRPRSQRRGTSAISERDVLHTMLIMNTNGQIGMRADEDTCLNIPLASAPRPRAHDECPAAGISENSPTTEEEARGYMNVFT